LQVTWFDILLFNANSCCFFSKRTHTHIGFTCLSATFHDFLTVYKLLTLNLLNTTLTEFYVEVHTSITRYTSTDLGGPQIHIYRAHG